MSSQYISFFRKNFLDFLLSEKDFFENNKKNYVNDFYQILIKNYPNINDFSINEIEDFYNLLFINPFLKTGKFNEIKEFIFLLNQNNIDKNLIDKSFLLIANKFIKYVFTKSDLKKLKILISLLDFYSQYLKTNIKLEIISNEIPKEIIKIFKNQEKIYLFSVYKSIPISNSSTILSLNKEHKTITINANNYQIIATQTQKEVYLVEPTKNLTFRAIVIKNNYYKKTVTFSDIEKVDRRSLKRNYLRVQPKEKIEAYMIVNDKKIKGEIFDISIRGISIISNSIDLKINDNIIIEFSLIHKTKKYNFSFISELKSISEYSEKYRYHFYFKPSIKEEKELEKFIKYREKEIINELMYYMKKEFIELS